MALLAALGLVIAAIVLLSIERIPMEVSSLAIVVLAAVTGLVTPEEALGGFASEAAIFIFALLALTQGLAATGVMQAVGSRMLSLTRRNPKAFMVLLLATVCAFSSVASNTAVTAAFLPVAISCATRLKMPASRLLMPLAFSSILGGTITLFGTSTNLVVSAEMESLGLERIGFLELARLGIPIAVAGIAATLFLARRVPERAQHGAEATSSVREYLTEAVLKPGSRLVGKALRHITEGLGVPVLALVKPGGGLSTDPAERVSAEDHLIVSGKLEDVLRVKDLQNVALRPEFRHSALGDASSGLMEVFVPATSGFVGKSLRELRFAERYSVLVLAIHRHPSLQRAHRHLQVMRRVAEEGTLRDVPIAAGDVLLLSGEAHRIRELAGGDDVTPLGAVEYERPRSGRAALALGIFACTIVAAGMRLTSPAIVGLAGLLAMIFAGCVAPGTAFRVDWRVVILIGSLLTLGRAMENSGAAEFLARGVVPLAGLIGPRGVLVVVMVLTILLSIPMSNQAAALIVLPVAVHAAIDMGFAPRTFAIATCLAASCSFLTPLEPSAALVYGPGRYRFADFLRIGGPLTAVILLVLSLGVPLLWPLAPR